jgi:hypothetical protein
MRLELEISTRKIGNKYFSSANITEYLNTLFPLIEQLRIILRENIENISKNNYFKLIYMETVDLIQLFLEFEDTWNYSYNTWQSNFKNKKSNVMMYDQLYEKRYLEIQDHFPYFEEIYNDIRLINDTIDAFLKAIYDPLIRLSGRSFTLFNGTISDESFKLSEFRTTKTEEFYRSKVKSRSRKEY